MTHCYCHAVTNLIALLELIGGLLELPSHLPCFASPFCGLQTRWIYLIEKCCIWRAVLASNMFVFFLNPKACGGMGAPAPLRALAMISITLRAYFRQQKQMYLVTQLAYKVFDTFSSAFSQFFPLFFFLMPWHSPGPSSDWQEGKLLPQNFSVGGDNLQQSEGIFLFFLFPTSPHPPLPFDASS